LSDDGGAEEKFAWSSMTCLLLVVLLVVNGNEGEFIGEVGLQFGEHHFGQISCQVSNGSLLGSALLGSLLARLGSG
jgi:hypothetical protein